MEKGDIGFVFPDIMQSMVPEYPIIKVEKVEPEVYRVINAILAN